MREDFRQVATNVMVNSQGVVIRFKRVEPRVAAKGRHLAVSCADKEPYVHRLVMQAFGPSAPVDSTIVCHRDGNPANNDISNLYWGTAQTNADDREAHGRTAKGERDGRSKLTAADVYAIRESLAPVSDLAAQYGVTARNIYSICARQTWRHI